MKKLFFAMLLCIIGLANASSCFAQSESNVLEFKYFHGKQRCVTCRNIEQYTLELLNTDYSKQMKSGAIKFTDVDISTDEGSKVATDYRAMGSSLFLVKGEERNNLTEMAFRYAKSNPDEFKRLLKIEIDKILKK